MKRAAKPSLTTSLSATPGHNATRVAGLALLVSLSSFLYYAQHGALLLYGDAVAHINIARRVIDSLTPGLLQLGTVWLPLPHILMIPFIWPTALWQNGSGGSIVSMVAYVFGVMGIFCLVRGMLYSDDRTRTAAEIGAWTAAFAYGANPNLIYMQATAMTESLYLAFFIWAVVYFVEFVREIGDNADAQQAQFANTALIRCAWCLAAAELTRYDGWFLAGVMGLIIVAVVIRQWNRVNEDKALRLVIIKFLVGISIAPILWLAYNQIVYGNALDFANGPYSAKAIEQRVNAPNPALHSTTTAAIYFLKSAQLNLATGNWGRLWLAAALLALVLAFWKRGPQLTAILLLWIPSLFYAYSIAYGSVPVHVSTWWPFATFNQRYGLQLLPMFAVSAGLLTAAAFLRALGRHGAKFVALLLALMVGSYAAVWKAEPPCLLEARRNWEIRNPINAAVLRLIKRLPSNSKFLMDTGEHVGIMQAAGIPLRQVVNTENHRAWVHPTDPEGLWEHALADPARYVDYVIAFEGDPVDRTANLSGLTALAEIHSTGQPYARVYATHAPNQSR